MRKFKADGRIETLKIGQEIRFIAGFALFNSTTATDRVAVGMSQQLNYTISDTSVLGISSFRSTGWALLLGAVTLFAVF